MTLYTTACAVCRVLFCGFFGMKMAGLENLPKDEPYIVLANHRAMADPFVLGVLCKGRTVHFMAKEELFRNPVVRWGITRMHGFPVRRGQTDLAAMRQALSVLREGDVLGIFPEGTRHREGTLGKLETGVSVLALKANVPAVPVYIGGRYRIGGKLRATVGKPVQMDDLRLLRPDRDTLETLNARIADALTSLANQ